MNDLSVRGVYRRYLVEPRKKFFGTDDPTIVGDLTNISVANDIMAGSSGSLRSYLEPLAFKRGPSNFGGGASWKENCEDLTIEGWVDFDQTWTHIDVRIQLFPDEGINSATLTSLQNTWQAGIEDYWNNPRHTLAGAPTPWVCARAGEAPCRISFKVHWVTSNAHHGVSVLSVRPAGFSANQGEWYFDDPGKIAAHEFGHMLGLADEYPRPDCPGRAPVSTDTIMDENETNFIPGRLVQWIADEIGSDLL